MLLQAWATNQPAISAQLEQAPHLYFKNEYRRIPDFSRFFSTNCFGTHGGIDDGFQSPAEWEISIEFGARLKRLC
jgi:hypothetical protein